MPKKAVAADPIVTEKAAILHKPMKEVPREMFGTKELTDIIRRMSASLRATEHGVAIAANQIAIPFRIFVVRGFVLEDKERSEEDADRAFINPKITKLSRKKEVMEEACLSVPGYHGTIKRALKATVKAYDEEGIGFERGASGLLAQVFQHECDHLDGFLYTDKAEHVEPTPKEDKK